MTTLLLCISTITKVCSVSSPHEKNVVSESPSNPSEGIGFDCL